MRDHGQKSDLTGNPTSMSPIRMSARMENNIQIPFEAPLLG